MENQKKLNLFAIFLVLVVRCSKVNGEPKVPCFFIFGDQSVDNGNNNNLATPAKGNFLPYGIDFPDGPTGRFCNSRTIADIFGEHLGFKNFIPSFLNVSKSRDVDILKGVNYASASAGIRPKTGKQFGVNIDLAPQIKNHQVIMSRIVDIFGNKSAANDHLSKCLYYSAMGTVDYLGNYFWPDLKYSSRELYTPKQFAKLLIQEYSLYLMRLYNLGARKVALIGVPPIGCLPGAMSLASQKGNNNSLSCVEPMNIASNLFNKRLKSLVNELNTKLTGAKFIYLDFYEPILKEFISNPDLKIEYKGCCKTNGYGICIPNEDPCVNRNSSLFFDSFLPTEFANRIGAEKSFPSLMKIL